MEIMARVPLLFLRSRHLGSPEMRPEIQRLEPDSCQLSDPSSPQIMKIYASLCKKYKGFPGIPTA